MPEVPIYTVPAPQREIRVPLAGIDTLAGAARRIGALGSEQAAMLRQSGADIERGLRGVAEGGAAIQQYQNTTDEMGVLATSAAMLNGLEDRRQRFMAGVLPGDTGAMQRFQDEQVQPEIDRMVDATSTLAGRKQALERGAAITEHFNTLNAAEVGRLAAQQANTDLATMERNYTNTLEQNPDSLMGVLDHLNAVGNTLSNYPGVNKAQVQKELQAARLSATITAGQSMARTAAEQGQSLDFGAFFKAHDSDLGGQGEEHLRNYMREQLAHHNEQVNADRTHFKQIQTEAYNRAADQLMTEVLSNPEGPRLPGDYFTRRMPELGQLAKDAGISPSAYETMYKFGQTVARGEKNVQTPDDVRTDFNSRAFLEPTDPRALTEQQVFETYNQGKLSNTDLRLYRDEVKARDSNDQIKLDANEIAKGSQASVKAQLTGETLFSPGNAGGHAAYARWLRDSIPEVRSQISHGKTPSQAWEYVSSPEYLRKYQPNAQDNLGGTLGAGGAPAAPAAPSGMNQEKANGILDKLFGGFSR